jgi:pimeloyl-ACP methyl ester carboxylesterase
VQNINPTRRLLRRGGTAAARAAAAGLAVALRVAPSASASAAPAPGPGPSHRESWPLPTVVLEHGAWADSASWDGVVQRLQQAGYTITGPVVLVGHSYGGAVITNAAAGDSQVKALVYVDAFAPAQTTIFNLAAYPGAPAGVYDAYVKQNLFPACFAGGLPASEGKMLAATQEPLSTIALSQPSGVPAWKTIPSWAVAGTADRVILEAAHATS